MLLPKLFLPLIIVLACWADAQSHDRAVEHAHANIEKMDQLMARWNRRHPVTFPPLSEETKGDIVPSDEDIAEMEDRLREDETDNSAIRSKRGASHRDAPNWPIDKPIPYIALGYNNTITELISAALKTFKENTCIEFAESSTPGPKLEYRDTGDGCQTNLGDHRSANENHLISLGPRCFSVSTVQHETMHALGFGHTMNRADRDNYMDFNSADLPPDEQTLFQFRPFNAEDFNNHSIPYEYNSVMHYSATAGSLNGKPILIPKDRDYIPSVGGDHGTTFNDWKALNLRYNCTEKMCNTTIYCQNNGYQHPRHCERCACPIFFTGTLCEKELNIIELHEETAKQLIFDMPFEYWNRDLDFTKFTKERHVIKAPEGRRIRITLNKIDPHIHFSCIRECDMMAVEIVDGDMSLVGKRFCCANTTGKSFVSKTNVVGYQAYVMPGLSFSSKVTFTIEPADGPLPEGPTTSAPITTTTTHITDTTTPPQTQNQTTVAPTTEILDSTMAPNSTEGPPNEPTTEVVDSTENSVTEEPATADDETEESSSDEYGTTGSVAEQPATVEPQEDDLTTEIVDSASIIETHVE